MGDKKIDGKPSINDILNRWRTCTGIPVGSRTVFLEIWLIFPLFGKVQTTDRQKRSSLSKRSIWAHRATCTGEFNEYIQYNYGNPLDLFICNMPYQSTDKSTCRESWHQIVELFFSWSKNVLQEWHAYIYKNIRTMVQFHVLELIFYLSGHFTCPELSF